MRPMTNYSMKLLNLDAVSQDAMSESQEELLGVVTVAPTPKRGVVTVAGTTAVANEGEGNREEGCTGGHSSQELPTTLAHVVARAENSKLAGNGSITSIKTS